MFKESELRTYLFCSKLHSYGASHIKEDLAFILVKKAFKTFLTLYSTFQLQSKKIVINKLIKQSISVALDSLPPDKQITSQKLFYKNYISHWFSYFLKSNILKDKIFFSGTYSTKYSYKTIFVLLEFFAFAFDKKKKVLYAFSFNESLDSYLANYDIINILKYSFLKENFPGYKKIVLLTYSCSSNIISSNTNYPNRSNYKVFESTSLDSSRHLNILSTLNKNWKENAISRIPSCFNKGCPKRKVCLNDTW